MVSKNKQESTQPKKVAIVYDWLGKRFGGGETTLLQIIKNFPEADIYCLVYNKKLFSSHLKKHKVSSSFLNKYPETIKNRPYLLLPKIKKAVESLNFSGYDLVISVSSAWVKNIKVNPKTSCHVSYVYSPARMLWDSWPGYLDKYKLVSNRQNGMRRLYITRLVSELRLWDYYQAQEPFELVSISNYISGRISKYYGRKSKVVYPSVDVSKFLSTNTKKKDYYICVSSLSRYKNIDLVIEAFINNKKELHIIGDGADRARLEALAAKHANIKFFGFVSENEKIQQLSAAKGFIFPSIEDFGIAPVEAMATGTGVIALRAGGLLETVKENKTGVFFNEATVENLNNAIARYEGLRLEREKLRTSVRNFNEERFDHDFCNVVGLAFNQWKNKSEK